MKRLSILVSGLLALICIYWLIHNPLCYNTNYWNDAGIPNSHMYFDIVDKNGTPNSIISIENETVVDYTYISYVWYNEDLQGPFIRAEVKDESIAFGNKRICVGSTRSEVQDAYRSCFIMTIKDLPDECLGYIDNNVFVIYYFDKENKVEKIQIADSI